MVNYFHVVFCFLAGGRDVKLSLLFDISAFPRFLVTCCCLDEAFLCGCGGAFFFCSVFIAAARMSSSEDMFMPSAYPPVPDRDAANICCLFVNMGMGMTGWVSPTIAAEDCSRVFVAAFFCMYSA